MQFAGTERCIATDELQLAVRAAIALQRPLLVKGEPGTGKTMLAEEMASDPACRSTACTSSRRPRRNRGFTSTTRAKGRATANWATRVVQHIGHCIRKDVFW